MVVLAHKDAGQIPQLGNVVGLEALALVGSAVTVERNTDGILAQILVGLGNKTKEEKKKKPPIHRPEKK